MPRLLPSRYLASALMAALVTVCIVAVAMASAVTPSAPDGAFHSKKLAELDAAIEQAVREGKLLGAALWVEREGAAHHRAFGQRAVSHAIEPMTEDTIFDLASVTKAVAAASAAMWCVDQGLFEVDDPVSRHLPEFTGEGREKITLRHLLLHTSGLQINLNGARPPLSRGPDEVLAQLCRERPRFDPGSAFAYSSTGLMVLGCVIDRVTGRTFDELCTTEIFRPLEMHDTGFRPGTDKLPRVAPTSSPARGQVDDAVAREAGNVAAHASLFSTAADLARFARMMLDFGELDGVRVFKPETVKLFTSVQSPPGLTSPGANGLPVRRGLGWDIDTPYRTPPHDYSPARGDLFPVGGHGHTSWTGQMLWIDPSSRTFVIFLCNRYVEGAGDTRPAVYRLHHRLSTLAAEAVVGVDFKNIDTP